MKHLSLLTLVFSILFAVFFLLLVFFRIPFPPYPLISYQDVFDILLRWCSSRSTGFCLNTLPAVNHVWQRKLLSWF